MKNKEVLLKQNTVYRGKWEIYEDVVATLGEINHEKIVFGLCRENQYCFYAYVLYYDKGKFYEIEIRWSYSWHPDPKEEHIRKTRNRKLVDLSELETRLLDTSWGENELLRRSGKQALCECLGVRFVENIPYDGGL